MSSFCHKWSLTCFITTLVLVLLTPLAMATGVAQETITSGTAATLAPMLHTVVVTGSRIEHSSFDMSASIDVITSEQMQDGQSMVNASESLARLPGIVAPNTYRLSSDQLVASRGFGTRAGFGVRGIRLYADGVPLTMPDGQGQMASFGISSAERMEVLRGPYSALYGNSSGGVIQLFTRDGKGAPRSTVNAHSGSFGSEWLGLTVEGQSGTLGYVIDTSRFQTDGYRVHSAARRDQLNAKISTHSPVGTKYTLLLNSLDQPYAEDPQGLTRAQMESNPQQASAAAVAQDAGGSKAQTHLGLNVVHPLSANDSLQAVGWLGSRESYGVLSTPFNAAPVIKGSGGIAVIDRNFFGVDLRWTHKTPTPTGALTTTMGLTYEGMKDVRTGFENRAGLQGVLRRDEDNLASSSDQYLQAEWNLGPNWILSGGLRQSRVSFVNNDRYIRTTGVGNPDDSGSVTYSNTSPVLGVVYHLTPLVNLYANAGRGFETPTFIELAYRSGGVSGLNFSLRPATSVNYEAGMKALLGDNTQVNLAVFNIRTDREIVVDSSAFGRTVYANAGKTERNGLELSVNGTLGHEIKANLAYTLLDAQFVQDYRTTAGSLIRSGNQLPGSPRTSVYVELSWKHQASGFSTAVEARYSDKVYVNDVNSDAAEAYTVVNWHGGFEQNVGALRFKEFLRVENLGDHAFVGGVLVNNNSPFAPAPGRNYLIGVSATMTF